MDILTVGDGVKCCPFWLFPEILMTENKSFSVSETLKCSNHQVWFEKEVAWTPPCCDKMYTSLHKISCFDYCCFYGFYALYKKKTAGKCWCGIQQENNILFFVLEICCVDEWVLNCIYGYFLTLRLSNIRKRITQNKLA